MQSCLPSGVRMEWHACTKLYRMLADRKLDSSNAMICACMRNVKRTKRFHIESQAICPSTTTGSGGKMQAVMFSDAEAFLPLRNSRLKRSSTLTTG